VAAALGWLGHQGLGLAFVDGPPLGVTGAFGEASCHQCHFDGDLNAHGGNVEIKGVPDTFEAGKRYLMTVTLSHESLKAGGFQLAARFADGDNKGASAGELRASDTRTRVAVSERRDAQYVHHTKEGTAPTTAGAAMWELEWIAPESGGKVAFHAASVAADGDVSPFGDFVYLRELITSRR
jgi:hypothetical protein